MAPTMQLMNALTLAMAVSPAAAAIKGFNYGATFNDGTIKQQADYEAEFKTAKGLVGAEDFTSARLYTMIQGGSTSTPVSAIPAAIAQNTTLLLGLWASGDTFDNEVTALKTAISTFGDDFAKLVVGISVGSEDLYRNSPTGIAAKAGIGKNPSDIVDDIKTVRSTIAGTGLAKVPIGHVDTWTAWVNSSNDAVIDEVDWIGLDAYPYFQNTDSNDVSSGVSLFQAAVNNVNSATKGKSLWVTETGWAVSGDKQNLAVASIPNAKTYWDEVGCGLLFDKVNTYWYILQDAAPTAPNPSFGIVGGTLSTTPLFNLTCPAVAAKSSSSSSSSSTTTSAGSKATGTTETPSSATSTSSPSSSSSSTSESSTSSSTGSNTNSGPGSSSRLSSPGSATSTPGASTPGGLNANGSGSSTPTGSTGLSGTGTSSSPVSTYTGAASSVSASMTGIVAAIFAAIIAF